MYGCGIGPVTRERHRKLAAQTLNRYVDAITLREPDSLTELRSMGVENPDTRLSADPALTLPPADDVLVDSTLLSHGVPPQGEAAARITAADGGLLEGYVRLEGRLTGPVDQESPIYVQLGDALYEACPAGAAGEGTPFTLYVPAEGAQGAAEILYQSGGQLYAAGADLAQAN